MAALDPVNQDIQQKEYDDFVDEMHENLDAPDLPIVYRSVVIA